MIREQDGFLYPKIGQYVKKNVTGGDASFRLIHRGEQTPTMRRRSRQ
jgi:hypothetical protein